MIANEPDVGIINEPSPTAIISKIHNLSWLKRDGHASTDSNPEKETKLAKIQSQKKMDAVTARKSKGGKGGRARKSNVDGSKENDVNFRNNEKPRAKGQKASETSITKPPAETKRSVTLNPEREAWYPPGNAAVTLFGNVDSTVNREAPEREAWYPPGNAAVTLFGNVDSTVNREALEREAWYPPGNAAVTLFGNVDSTVNREALERENLDRTILESMKDATSNTHQTNVISSKEAIDKADEKSEDEDSWGKVRRNLPTPESEEDKKHSDANNNGGAKIWKNSSILTSQLDFDDETVNLKDAHVDIYGRVNGRTECHLFMGKGGRMKEQKFLEQLQLKSQLENSVVSETKKIDESKSANPPRESVRNSKQTAKIAETPSTSFENRSQTRKPLKSETESVSGCSSNSVGVSQPLRAKTKELPKNSEDFSVSAERSTNLSRDAKNFPKKPESKVSNETPTAARTGRPILSGDNLNDNQRGKNRSTSGQSANKNFSGVATVNGGNFEKSGNDFNGPGGRGFDRNRRDTDERARGDSGRGRNSYSAQGNLDQDGNGRGRSENRHKWINKDLIGKKDSGDRVSSKYNEERNREVSERLKTDKNNEKSSKEFIEKDQNNEKSPKEFSEIDQNNEKLPEELIEIDQNNEKSPEELIEIDQNNEKSTQELIKIDQNIENSPEQLIKTDQNPEKSLNIQKSPENSIKTQIHSQIPQQKSNAPTSPTPQKLTNRPLDSSFEEPPQKFEKPFVATETQPEESPADKSNDGDATVPHTSQSDSRSANSIADEVDSFATKRVKPSPEATAPSAFPDGAEWPKCDVPSTSESSKPATIAFCGNCNPFVPLEIRYARLRWQDPLLYNLLVQTQARDSYPLPTENRNAENSPEIPTKTYEQPGNYDCDGQSSNDRSKTPKSNSETRSTAEEWPLDDSQASELPPVDAFDMASVREHIPDVYEDYPNHSYFENSSSFPTCNVASNDVSMNYRAIDVNQNVQRRYDGFGIPPDEYSNFPPQMYRNNSIPDPRYYPKTPHLFVPRYLNPHEDFPYHPSMEEMFYDENPMNGQFPGQQFPNFHPMENQTHEQWRSVPNRRNQRSKYPYANNSRSPPSAGRGRNQRRQNNY